MAALITPLQGNMNTKAIKRKRAGGICFTPANVSGNIPYLENEDEEYFLDLYESDGINSEISEDGTDVTPTFPKKRRRAGESPGLSSKTLKKQYKCMFEGCKKAYTKLTRLEEHKRSHTGEVRAYGAYKHKDSLIDYGNTETFQVQSSWVREFVPEGTPPPSPCEDAS